MTLEELHTTPKGALVKYYGDICVLKSPNTYTNLDEPDQTYYFDDEELHRITVMTQDEIAEIVKSASLALILSLHQK